MEIDKILSNWIKWMTMDKIDKCGWDGWIWIKDDEIDVNG